ncbi:YdeI/OmpD-associated family protein [Mucilaginibacter sabulilitoris]|uniref:YdeI/OmpD-associated family protein n=1 Tax=Mucilaginibacter sabulilitoris TaxID=1173583 RepID=A0ABZ0TR84_9SPHI|nr:YdeI/OmpD-associated family protein [Mucilaginibacter sabulilitoris]WPU95271.1 YdeI/OmpD-associated family protein [Mucilaginibacter sabulilitoris]
MKNFDPKVDEYIATSADFAKPVLEHWRQLIHDNCPDVVEAIKWGFPHFDYKGDFMCVIASYKNHCSFTFLKAELMNDARLKDSKTLKPIQRFLGKVTKLSDLPPDEEFIGMLKEAMVLNEKGIKVMAPKSDKPKVLEMPDYFSEKLAGNAKAKAVFESKSDSFRKDYIIWISDAKTDATRQKRMEEAIEWIAEGKGRFWKYEK